MKEGITILSKFFVSQDRNKNLCKGPLPFSRKFLVSKKFMDMRWHITIFNRSFHVSQYRKNSWASLQGFRKLGVSKKFIHNRGYHVLPSKFFGLTVPKYFIGEHFRVSEKIFYQKLSCIGRRASRFCRNFLSHRTETKIFVKDLFRFPENFWYRKKLWIWGGISRFSIEVFMSRSTEKIRGHPFNVSENLGYRKNFFMIGVIKFFCRKFLVWLNQIISFENTVLFQKNSLIENFHA